MLWAFEHAIARLFWKKSLSMSTKGTVKLTLNIFDTRMSFSCLLYMFLSSRPLFALMLCSIFVNLDQLFVCLKSSKEQKKQKSYTFRRSIYANYFVKFHFFMKTT